MNENHPPEVHEFYRGSSNQIAIRAYMEIKDDGEIARLAATMAPHQKTFAPAALVDAAIALQDEAKASLVRRREALVETMNYRTLLSLQQELGVSLSLYVDDDDENLRDPVVGPVLRRLRSTVSDGLKNSDALDKAHIADELAKADSRTKIPRPALPCDLEDALRYATNSPNGTWFVLRDAFVDFLGIYRTSHQRELQHEDEEYLRNQIEHTSRILVDIEKSSKHDPIILASKREHEEKLKSLQNDLTIQQAVKTYRESFVPGITKPPHVAEESSAIYAKYWKEPNSVDHEVSLAWFSTEFYSFWKKHCVAYQKVDADAEDARKIKAAKSREAAFHSVASREHAKWLKRTKAFIIYLNSDGKRQNPDAIQNSVKTYAKHHSGLKDKHAKARLNDFLGTLCNPAARGWDAATVCDTFQKCGIKACAEATIHECLNLLNVALNQGRKKK